MTGCQGKSAFTEADAAEYFPLYPGSTWTYLLSEKHRGQSHEDIETFQVFSQHVLAEDRLTAHDGASQVVCEADGSNGNCVAFVLYSKDGDYINRTNILGGLPANASKESRFLPRFLRPGLAWGNTLFPFADLSESFHVTQTHRTFLEANDIGGAECHFRRCIRVETEAVYESSAAGPLHLSYLDWYAAHVGLVQTRVFIDSLPGTEITRVELLSYSIPRDQKHERESLRRPSLHCMSIPLPARAQ